MRWCDLCNVAFPNPRYNHLHTVISLDLRGCSSYNRDLESDLVPLDSTGWWAAENWLDQGQAHNRESDSLHSSLVYPILVVLHPLARWCPRVGFVGVSPDALRKGLDTICHVFTDSDGPIAGLGHSSSCGTDSFRCGRSSSGHNHRREGSTCDSAVVEAILVDGAFSAGDEAPNETGEAEGRPIANSYEGRGDVTGDTGGKHLSEPECGWVQEE